MKLGGWAVELVGLYYKNEAQMWIDTNPVRLGCTLREECQLLREYNEGSTWNEIEDVKRGSRREIEKMAGRQKERGTGWEAADRGIAWTEDVFKSYENATEKGHDSADRSGVGVEIRIWLEAWWWGWRNCS